MSVADKQPLNLLILTGMICQGYSWDNSWAPLIYALLGIVGIVCQSKHKLFSANGKALILLLSFILFKLLGQFWGYGFNRLIYLGGNFLIVYQFLHLLDNANVREKKTAFLIALMHIGASTQIIVDFKAPIVIGLALTLIPLTLRALAGTKFPTPSSLPPPRRFSRLKESLSLGFLMILFFIAFPRFGFQSRPIPPLLTGAGGVAGSPAKELDSAGSGSDIGRQLIFRIEGENIGYLKTHAYDEFDGVKWTASPWSKKMKRGWRPEMTEKALERTVRMVNYKALGDVLPVDGNVQYLKVYMVSPPYIAGDGSVKTGFNHRSNLNYTYWTFTNDDKERLDKRESDRYTELPPQNYDRIKQWLNGYLANEKKTSEQIEKLLHFFHTEFTYNIGGPDLNRINPLEEFIFEHRQGHCERFASAMAVLLRLRGIPARVGIGFLPLEKNDIGNFYNVSTKHAHAWTEAFLPGKGWMIVDATPYGEGLQIEHQALTFTIFESIEYFWYSKIVEFGVNEQREVFNGVLSFIKDSVVVGASYTAILFPVAVGLVLLILMIRFNWRKLLDDWIIIPWRAFKNRRSEVGHFYAQMLRLLARQKLHRQKGQTPLEFLGMVEETQHPRLHDIRLITQTFCAVRYGQQELSSELMSRMQTALRAIKF